MTLVSGTKLGPYEIVSSLGAGGMGEVYRARDTRLGRDVAVKVLPQHLSSDPDLKQRFEREARAISALSNPHICHLYDVGSQDGTDYLIMELLEGETLAARLQKGPLPLKRVVEYGAQIAEALEKAHKNGIVHRDLKPGNVMLTKSGAKLLDFGLAKPAVSMGAAASESAETMSKPLTGEGKIVGTFQYMAPEQIEGKESDTRTDIFAFGTVLYEMVTGKRAFPGKSQISVMSAILEKEPEPISAVQPLTPLALDHVIRRALAKDPEERWQSEADVKVELKWIGESHEREAIPSAATAGPARLWAGWAAALTVTLAAAFFGFAFFHKQAPEAHVVRSMLLPPEGGAFVFNGLTGGAFISPDGETVAFIARVGKVTQLWIRPLNALAARPLAGTEDAAFAFWSPDSRNLGFYAQGKLKRIAASGGPPKVLCEPDSLRGASWGRDVIIFARVGGEIESVPASGGTRLKVTKLDSGRLEGTHRWPYFLPDGNHFLFVAEPMGPVGESAFYVGSVDGKTSTILARGDSNIAYGSGYVLYLVGGALMARPFDPARLHFTGEEKPVVESIVFDSGLGRGMFSVADGGNLLFQQGKALANSVWLLDHTGKPTKNLGEAAPGAVPRFSPDGKSIVFDSLSSDSDKIDLWLQDLASGSRIRVASDGLTQITHSAIWSPDGRYLAYCTGKSGARAIYIKPVNQIAQEERRWEPRDGTFAILDDWSPDGKALILMTEPSDYGKSEGGMRTSVRYLSLLPVLGKGDPVPLLEVKGANVSSSQVSPDGRWIAYRSDESGKYEIYISSFPSPTGKLQISADGGSNSRWRHDGRALYYLAPDKKLMAAELRETNGSLQVTSNLPSFEMPQTSYLAPMATVPYDVTHDGSRFALNSVSAEESATPLSLVQNWAEELNK